MRYPPTAVEQAMKIHEVLLRAISGALTWLQAADILGMRPRSLRGWRRRYERHGYDGLLDRCRGVPSPRRAPFAAVQQILRLYRERYAGFNVRHFHELARRSVRGDCLVERLVFGTIGSVKSYCSPTEVSSG